MTETKEKYCPQCHRHRIVDERKWGPIVVGRGRNLGKTIGYRCPDCVAKKAQREAKK